LSESKKLSHVEAAYREFGTPGRHCAVCSMYRDREKNRCTLVEDPIAWYGWCKHFQGAERNVSPAAREPARPEAPDAA
jgi:hypothetical protein